MSRNNRDRSGNDLNFPPPHDRPRCHCGCGAELSARPRGRPRKWIDGHRESKRNADRRAERAERKRTAA